MLAASLGAPTQAQAQQTGLLPLHPIKRERVPCAAEDPIYRLYRQQYFGYHPTCWRRFPAGWGCPSPEAPNPAEAFRKLPRDQPSTDAAAGPAAPGAGNPDDMPLPGDDMPKDPGAAPGGNGPRPGALPPLPPGGRSPFDLDPKPGEGGTTPPAREGAPADRVAPPADDEPRAAGTPRTPATQPAAPSTAVPPARSGASAERAPDTIEPLLSVPDPTVGPTSGPAAPGLTSAADLGTAPPVARAQPPKRPSLLGSLFGGRGARRR